MTYFEEKLRELASKAKPAHEWHDCGDYVAACSDMVCNGCLPGVAAHIAFNDPETATLVADVIAAARECANAQTLTEICQIYGRLQTVFAALDAHHEKGEG